MTSSEASTRPSAHSNPLGDDVARGPVDGVLLVGFGGPEAANEIVDFLEVVTAGSGIPRERLAQVGEHYHLFGGRSPINDQCRALRTALEEELRSRGHDWPVLWGNRNWHPFIDEALDQARRQQLRRLVVVTTSAYPSYSGCRSYREALARVGADFEFVRIGNYALDEAFLAVMTDAVRASLDELGGPARLVFVTHSIPVAMDEASGAEGGAYLKWHAEVAADVAGRLGIADHDLVFCSRSGPPQQLWLEPDINDHLETLAAAGVERVVVAPIGFISDHMEVIYDLDTQARETCERVGITMLRAATVGVDPRFVAGLIDRVEAAATRAGDPPPGCGGTDCCRNLRAPETVAVG